MRDELERPSLRRDDWVAVGAVTLIVLFGVVIFLLVRLPWFARWREAPYLNAMSAIASAATAVFTLAAAIVTGVYVALTYLLWRQNQRSQQTVLMQQLMVEYDGLRDAIRDIREWFKESAGAGVDPVHRFEAETEGDVWSEKVEYVDDARFRVSRYFVRIRKLALAGFLDRRIIAMALGPDAMDVFLVLVDPLDQVIHERAYGYANITDREFFQAVVRDHGELAGCARGDASRPQRGRLAL